VPGGRLVNSRLTASAAAATLKDQVEQLGDELLDHFVKDARDAGCSWTQIGEALGVTRQAAQQRHGGLFGRLVEGLKAGKFQRFTKRDRRHPHLDDRPAARSGLGQRARTAGPSGRLPAVAERRRSPC
jgi:hypothetical protein